MKQRSTITSSILCSECVCVGADGFILHTHQTQTISYCFTAILLLPNIIFSNIIIKICTF